MRSGAVVRCEACEHKFRIKSTHFAREIHTGPRTLDESDDVLGSDSVDIDPDEVAPVSIDDDGNVVGLSGLSELMRWSDSQDQSQVTGTPSPTRSRGKAQHDADDDLPEAKPARSTAKAASAGASKTASKAKPKTTPAPRTARERAQALKRKKQMRMYAGLGGVVAALLLVAIVIAITLPGRQPDDATATSDGSDTNLADTNDPKPDNPDTETPVDDPGESSTNNGDANPNDPGSNIPDTPDTPDFFGETFEPSPNPEPTFQAPWLADAGPPADAPPDYLVATALNHEGWYVLNPPRKPREVLNPDGVTLGDITPIDLGNGTTVLSCQLFNSSDRTLADGELHIRFTDRVGNIFAETYAKLALIDSKTRQPYAVTVPTRYWKRCEDVLASVSVDVWADDAEPIEGVILQPNGLDEGSAVRVSLKHSGERALKNIEMLLHATDDEGHAIACFHVKRDNLFIRDGNWLDLVVATPLPEGAPQPSWSAKLVSR